MQIDLTEDQYRVLKTLVLKYEALNKTTNNAPKKTDTSTKFKNIVLDMGILESEDFSRSSQKGMIESYKNAYNVLGDNLYYSTLLRVKHLADLGKVKNIKAYGLACLEKEITKKK